jgi:hypothetical protein
MSSLQSVFKINAYFVMWSSPKNLQDLTRISELKFYTREFNFRLHLSNVTPALHEAETEFYGK